MKTATRKLRSPLKWHGGKSYLARRIVALMPEHRVYVEPFLGGGSVLLNKPKSEVEVAGDLNRDLVNLWNAIRLEGDDRFARLLELIPYNEEMFVWAAEPAPTAFEWAARTLIRNRFSRGGLGKTFAWSDRLRGGQPGDVNAWETIKAELPAIAERIGDVEFFHADALTLVDANDSPETLHYLDPPYLQETRTAKHAYGEFEMAPGEHVALLDLIRGCQGAVILSGYRSKLYDEALSGWDRVEIEIANHSGQGKNKQRRVECLWSNRPLKDKEAS